MDTENLLKSLNAHNVRYVVIGATAFPVHGYARATLDVDIFIEATEENAIRTLEALSEFGYDVTDLTVGDLLTHKILIRQYMVETDIHPFVKGVTFDEVWADRVADKIGDTPAYFASLDALIKMKEAASRPKDLEDLKILRALKQR
jgi:predicted nucleotidyltransferase